MRVEKPKVGPYIEQPYGLVMLGLADRSSRPMHGGGPGEL